MKLEIFIYLAELCGTVKNIFPVVFFILLGIFCFFRFIAFVEHSEKKFPLGTKTMIAIFSFLCLVGLFTPSEKTMYMMAGIHVGKEIAKNERVNKLTEQVYDLIEFKINEYTKEKNNN